MDNLQINSSLSKLNSYGLNSNMFSGVSNSGKLEFDLFNKTQYNQEIVTLGKVS